MTELVHDKAKPRVFSGYNQGECVPKRKKKRVPLIPVCSITTLYVAFIQRCFVLNILNGKLLSAGPLFISGHHSG